MGWPHGVSGFCHPSGSDSGESMDTRSGRAAMVWLTSPSSVLKLLVVAIAPFVRAHPVARFALPVRSIPTTLGVPWALEHFSSSRRTRLLGLLGGSAVFPRRFVRGRRSTPWKMDFAD